MNRVANFLYPGTKTTGKPASAVRSGIANDLRQFLFEIRPRVLQQQLEVLRSIGVAGDIERTAANGRTV